MCGIAGFLGRSADPAAKELAQRMISALAHRGPDGRGVHVDGPVALGHTRLSIIDLCGRPSAPARRNAAISPSASTAKSSTMSNSATTLVAGGVRFRTRSRTPKSSSQLYQDQGRGLRRRSERRFRLRDLGPAPAKTDAGARPHGRAAALLDEKRRAALLRLRGQGAAGDRRGRGAARSDRPRPALHALGRHRAAHRLQGHPATAARPRDDRHAGRASTSAATGACPFRPPPRTPPLAPTRAALAEELRACSPMRPASACAPTFRSAPISAAGSIPPIVATLASDIVAASGSKPFP